MYIINTNLEEVIKEFDFVDSWIDTVCENILHKEKENCKITEIYCHTSKKIGTENLIVEDYQKPEKFYVDLDTSTPIDQTFERLIKMLI